MSEAEQEAGVSLVAGLGSIDEDESGDMKFQRKSAKNSLAKDTNKRAKIIHEIEVEHGGEMDPEDLEDELELRLEKEKKAARQQVFSTKVNPRLYRKWDKIAKKNGKSVVVAMEESMLAFLKEHGVDFEF